MFWENKRLNSKQEEKQAMKMICIRLSYLEASD